MLPFIAPLLSGIGAAAAGIGSAGLAGLGAAGNVLGTGLATVAKPVAEGIGFIGKDLIAPSLGYAKQGAEFVGPPEKFSLAPALSTATEAGVSYGVSKAMAPKPQGGYAPPPVSYQPQFGDPGPSKYASELSPEAYKRVSRRLQNQYGGFRI